MKYRYEDLHFGVEPTTGEYDQELTNIRRLGILSSVDKNE